MNTYGPYTAHDMLLMHYAAGRLGVHEAVIVAAHVAMNEDARARVRAFEALGASLMCCEKPAAVTPECLSRVLSGIEKNATAPQEPTPCDAACAERLHIPLAVYTLLSCFCAHHATQWSKAAAGVSKIDLAPDCGHNTAQKRLRLMKMDAASTTPAHRHAGRELTLILDGGMTDGQRHYGPGDIVIIDDPAHIHEPVAAQAGCVCLMLTDAPLRFISPLRRFINIIQRI